MTIRFPRSRDQEPWAWGLNGPEPVHIWERFSPAYEAQAERLIRALERLGFCPFLGGAGSEDGEYAAATRPGSERLIFLFHLEEPAGAEALAKIEDSDLEEWISDGVSPAVPPEGFSG